MKRLILAMGLAGMLGCKDVRTEYSKPVKTEVEITQKYVSARTTDELSMCMSFEGDLEPCVKTEHYPAKYLTTIKSVGCTQTINDFATYNRFQNNKPAMMEYVDIYRNTYGQRPNSAEKETILLESQKTGCEFRPQF